MRGPLHRRTGHDPIRTFATTPRRPEAQDTLDAMRADVAEILGELIAREARAQSRVIAAAPAANDAPSATARRRTHG